LRLVRVRVPVLRGRRRAGHDRALRLCRPPAAVRAGIMRDGEFPGSVIITRADRQNCARVAVALALVIGEGVKLGEVVDVLGAVLVPEIMEAALLAC
jgi:hypothetical protein